MSLITLRAKSKPKQKSPGGVILYAGPSLWDDTPIVAIATGLKSASANRKTGDLIQVWILSDAGESPCNARFKSGRSASICGDCKHDRSDTCYVNVGQAPQAVYNAYKRGSYPIYNAAQHSQQFSGRNLRLGAYGDPAMVPLSVWCDIVPLVKAHTAYTHQWSKDYAQEYKRYAMASVDSQAEYLEAKRLGWRTFRVHTAEIGRAHV